MKFPFRRLAVVLLLALFGQMERTYTLKRAAHARAVATAKGRRVGRPVLVDPAKLARAGHLRDAGRTIAEMVAITGIPRTSLYRHLPPRPPEPVTAGGTGGAPTGTTTKLRRLLVTGTSHKRPPASFYDEVGEGQLSPLACMLSKTDPGGARARPRPRAAGPGRRPGAAVARTEPKTHYFKLRGRLLDRSEAGNAGADGR